MGRAIDWVIFFTSLILTQRLGFVQIEHMQDPGGAEQQGEGLVEMALHFYDGPNKTEATPAVEFAEGEGGPGSCPHPVAGT